MNACRESDAEGRARGKRLRHTTLACRLRDVINAVYHGYLFSRVPTPRPLDRPRIGQNELGSCRQRVVAAARRRVEPVLVPSVVVQKNGRGGGARGRDRTGTRR